ncbi:M28 family metallopeptidase [Siphonobacter aquaeclarae]|uniref:Peptidase family M28 n=1 Tax=Siphonobacter aquaeclarae TaxID=563176 RepID=A0A1G9R4K0_9BACT|nr:M28 family metallopeptidase [Siphonobacter aquaeclarae]SDM18226.1 Peptidase family M28 [Siphonobacter aquaeclarae]
MFRRFIFLLSLSVTSASAQQIVVRDPEISQYVSRVSADSLRSTVHKLVSFGTRHTLSTTSDAGKGIGAARNWVLSRFRQFGKTSGGRLTADLQTWTLKAGERRIDKDHDIANVVATLKGTDPADSRVFVISAHLDSRAFDIMNRDIDAPGANDDGSGVATVLEAARLLSASKFPATVIFLVVSGEEQGLYGAEYFAKQAFENKTLIEAVLNNDTMGSSLGSETALSDNTRVRVFSEGLPAYQTAEQAAKIRGIGAESDGKARQLARYLKETGERYVDQLEIVLIFRNDRFQRGGDHTPFVNNGFAAVRITEMNENFDHQHQDIHTANGTEYGDLEKFMDFEYLRKNTAANIAALANLAKAPAAPEEVQIDLRGPASYAKLAWKAPKAGKVKGYYILMRETYQPFWQKKIFTKDLSVTLPYSRDSYFFAIQAVGEDGNESLPVIPKP